MEVMLLTVLCSHFMRINVAPLCANYHLLSRIKRERIHNSKYHNHSTSVAIHVDTRVRTLSIYWRIKKKEEKKRKQKLINHRNVELLMFFDEFVEF